MQEKTHTSNIMEEDSEGYLKISKGNGKVFSRQSAPLVYEHASSTYIISRNFLENGQFLYDAKIKGFTCHLKEH